MQLFPFFVISVLASYFLYQFQPMRNYWEGHHDLFEYGFFFYFFIVFLVKTVWFVFKDLKVSKIKKVSYIIYLCIFCHILTYAAFVLLFATQGLGFYFPAIILIFRELVFFVTYLFTHDLNFPNLPFLSLIIKDSEKEN
jgi:hypothetical protein